MTQAERLLRDKIARRAQVLAPEFINRQLAAYEIIRGALNEAELVAAIKDGTIDELLNALLSDQKLDGAFAKLRARIDTTLLHGSAIAGRDLPAALAATFDILNPVVIRAARALDTKVIDGLKDEVRETVRNHVQAGMEAGTGPRTIARGLRKTVGMAPNQEEAVRNFERMLRAGDTEALTRKLRDHRFDRTLRKALKSGGLSEEQIRTMTDAYRRRMIAFNAETHARTIALDTQRLAQRMSWENAIAKGLVERSNLQRMWIAVGGPTGDGRNRPEHLALHGTVVGFDQPYPNGEMVPGDADYNCRCVERVTRIALGSVATQAA